MNLTIFFFLIFPIIGMALVFLLNIDLSITSSVECQDHVMNKRLAGIFIKKQISLDNGRVISNGATEQTIV